MEGEKIWISQRQLQRLEGMGWVEAGMSMLKEGADKMGVSYRQTKRIRKRAPEKGGKGLIHGNTGNPSNHRRKEGIKATVLKLSQKVYGEFHDQPFTEKLAEEEGIEGSRETVRMIRRAAGMGPKRRGKKHRKRRERKAQEGWMVLWDGSPHPWFGPHLPPCGLMAAIDDATGAILAARFLVFEGTEGYLWLLRQIVTPYGIPISAYQDHPGSLNRNDDHWTLEEELVGRQEPTQVGQALRTLGIQPIFALSPQAKGRIKRLFGTLQEPIRVLRRNRSPAISPRTESHNWVYQASAQPIYDKPFG